MTSLTNEIKAKLDVVEVLGSYVKLEKAGQNYKARCPFHNEKTPSFFVSPGRGSYYCFGCGAKGDIFSFVEHIEGLDFMGALKVLAEKAGIPLRHEKTEKMDEKARLYDLMDEAAAIFEKNLAVNNEATKYLHDRGLTNDTQKGWRLGYANGDWRDAHDKLLARGWKREEMLSCGLIKESESKREYDVFRDRIMFPIFDGAGRVIAFSGRIFGPNEKDSAKYLNSPETQLFKKSETLYGIHRAKTGIRRLGFAILVEGQMDLLMCHQAGFDNTVATSGTSLTEGHVSLLKRFSQNLVLAYDNDTAGEKASLKAFALALSSNLHVRVLKIKEGKDPADLIKQDKEAWKKALKDAKHIVSFVWESLKEQVLPRDKFVERFRENVLPILSSLPTDGERLRLISEHKMAIHTGIREEYLMEEAHKVRMKQEEERPRIAEVTDKLLVRPPADAGRRLCAILFALEDGSMTGKPRDVLKERLRNIAGENFEEIYEQHRGERSRLVFEAESIYGSEVEEKELEELLRNFEEDKLREQLLKKMTELNKAEMEKNDDTVINLLAECQKITMRIDALKKSNEQTGSS